MGAPITGSGGKVKYGPGPTTIEDIRNWSVDRSAEGKPYNSSSTAGQTKRLSGNKDWTGSFEYYLDAGDPDIGPEEGDLVDLELHTADAAHKYNGNALIVGIAVEVDVESAEIIGGTVTFEGNGALSKS